MTAAHRWRQLLDVQPNKCCRGDVHLMSGDANQQAVRNEDTRGDAAQLRLEIRRLNQQLQAWKEAALAAGVAPDGQGGGGPDSGGSGDPRGGAASSRGSSRRSSQRKVAVNNSAPWGEVVSGLLRTAASLCVAAKFLGPC